MSAIEILKAAKALPLEERVKLAEDLWDDIGKSEFNPDLTPEQVAELDRRVAELEKNPDDAIPLKQVLENVNKRFGWK